MPKDPQPINLTIDTKLLRAQIDELEKKVTEVREARTILLGVAKMAEIAKTKPPDGRGQWRFQFDFDFTDNVFAINFWYNAGRREDRFDHSVVGKDPAECFAKLLEVFK